MSGAPVRRHGNYFRILCRASSLKLWIERRLSAYIAFLKHPELWTQAPRRAHALRRPNSPPMRRAANPTPVPPPAPVRTSPPVRSSAPAAAPAPTAPPGAPPVGGSRPAVAPRRVPAQVAQQTAVPSHYATVPLPTKPAVAHPVDPEVVAKPAVVPQAVRPAAGTSSAGMDAAKFRDAEQAHLNSLQQILAQMGHPPLQA
eukprot:TRINITY_DN31842_c0_g1_i1.p1 TRINITY_DN31842_c0_g1~~TRINITY_DN31842_c0_g1_i1.p1  ORF type:complete len:200 (-),score=33.93 TRINITY_DN31842_c0_g1_i1:87-686(-)